MSDGYKALTEGAGILDLEGRGLIRATGEDRARLLHAMCSNNVEELKPGQSCYAFFLTAQGRILADMNLYCFEDRFLLETEPEHREKVYRHLDRYIIADDVTLADDTEALSVIGVEGPNAEAVLEAAGLPRPEAAGGFIEDDGVVVARLSVTGAAGFRIVVSSDSKGPITDRLTAAGAVAATAADMHVVRVENGRPRSGEDLTEDYIPHETQVMRAVDFHKGCYLGQEIVERVRSRGNVNKLLVRLELEGDTAPEKGTVLIAEGKDAGVITSAAYSPRLARVAALGYVRARFAKEGVTLDAGGRQGEIVALNPN